MAEQGGRIHYAVIAGLCASVASFCGKLTSSDGLRLAINGNVQTQIVSDTLCFQLFHCHDVLD